MADSRRPGWWQRSRKWVVGAILAGLAASIVTAVSVVVSETGSAIWRQINPEPALRVDAAGDLTSFQRVALFPPEFVLPATVSELDAPPGQTRSYEEREEWATAHGGVRANLMEVQVTVTGNADQPVLLTNLRVDVLQRRPPLSGTHVTYGPIGEPVTERFLAVNLDERPPAISHSADERPRSDSNLQPDPIDFPYQVQRGDIEVFYLYVTTETCDCDWNAELFYSIGGEQRTVIVQDGDRPFRLTASGGAETYVSNDGRSFTPATGARESTVTGPSPMNAPAPPSTAAPGMIPVSCIEDPAGDTAPRADELTDIVRLCATYSGEDIRVTARPAGTMSPLQGGYDHFAVMVETNTDGSADYYVEVPSDGGVTVMDLAGAQPQVCTGNGGWDGVDLWVEFASGCVKAPPQLGIYADLVRFDGSEALYDNVPDLPPRGRVRQVLSVALVPEDESDMP
jgi:hypothetical protein